MRRYPSVRCCPPVVPSSGHANPQTRNKGWKALLVSTSGRSSRKVSSWAKASKDQRTRTVVLALLGGRGEAFSLTARSCPWYKTCEKMHIWGASCHATLPVGLVSGLSSFVFTLLFYVVLCVSGGLGGVDEFRLHADPRCSVRGCVDPPHSFPQRGSACPAKSQHEHGEDMRTDEPLAKTVRHLEIADRSSPGNHFEGAPSSRPSTGKRVQIRPSTFCLPRKLGTQFILQFAEHRIYFEDCNLPPVLRSCVLSHRDRFRAIGQRKAFIR